MTIGVLLSAAIGSATAQEPAPGPFRFQGAACTTPPPLHCPDANCPGDRITHPGSVVEMTTRRTYFLDYPCDLKAGEAVTFVLNLHGGGSLGNWQRHYFPIFDFKDQYRLVIASPNSPTRVWSEADDAYLRGIVSSVVDQIGRERIKAFWLAGHSQGGLTSNRLLRTEFFATRVDGWLSLSGGRLGGAPGRAATFGLGGAPAARPAAAPAAPRISAPAGLPDADFSFIFTTGEREMDDKGLPATSEWAAKYGCGPRQRRPDVVDEKAGYIYDSSRQNPPNPSWGLLPAPGTAEVFSYPGCRDGRVVADVVRLKKGHTEGLEPRVTEEIVKLMIGATGGKLQRAK